MERTRCRVVGENEELNNYVMKAGGISREGLNIIFFIGLFIFGWLMTIAFDKLGKKGLGWLYFILFIFPLISIVLIPLAILIYVVAWVHANRLLSRYESLAHARITDIDALPSEGITADILLEKGLLQQKVLRQQEQATATFTTVLPLPNSDPDLLNRAGVIFSRQGRYADAKRFFEKALPRARDEKLAKRIKKNISLMENSLGQ